MKIFVNHIPTNKGCFAHRPHLKMLSKDEDVQVCDANEVPQGFSAGLKKNINCLPVFIFTAILFFCTSCNHQPVLFESVSSSLTGIHFNNKVEENDKYNVLEYMNIYTGAGVGAGDINNDGLVDLYFSGNQTSCKLYLNKGNFKFEDITEKAGLVTNRWCTGISMVDINGDGFLDIYVNVAGSPKFGDMRNLLYINNKNETFTESAEKYGIAETKQTMNASFFDYDRDGDLDLFLITNPANEMVTGVNSIRQRMVKGESAGTDILYRNNGPSPASIKEGRGEVTFTDVSKAAGILIEGYSLGAAVSDVNGDGWPDIYISNDFLTNDILYINNGNGTFSDKTAASLKHTSFASMGNDIADFNNDGRPDIYTLDMLPEGNYRRKMIIPPAGYDKFQLSLQKGYNPQYTRNALQLNNGLSSASFEEGRGEVTFSDVSFLAGVSSTDWSWSALWADYDNDGDKDLMVTNGFYRDLGDLDYINYQTKLQSPMGKQDAKRNEKLKAIKDLANVPLQNYLFENNNDLTFTTRTDDWGFQEKGFSNGASYADLDNDGDLDLVINCFNSEARIYKNNVNLLHKNNYLAIKLKGSGPNVNGIGAKVWLYTKGKLQFQEFYPYRGYESSVEPIIHFGMGVYNTIDSLRIVWPDGKSQSLATIKVNQTISLNSVDATFLPQLTNGETSFKKDKRFTNITGTRGLNYLHTEPDFVDFKVQPLLPHMFSKNGPGIAVGDVNGDGLEDFFIGGTAAGAGNFFLQTKDGKFTGQALSNKPLSDNMGVLLFDADNDRDLDLYIVGGGAESNAAAANYQDNFYTNDGKGNFTDQPNALPDTKASGSCVVACDYDHDGDLDLFVGGRVSPGKYPMPPASYLLRNEGVQANGSIKFTDVTKELCPQLANIGMVCTALWSDYDNDGWNDLILAGEFMPFTIIKNSNGKKMNPPVAVEHSKGWWNSMVAGDFDNDGDIDFLAGNLGLNSRHKASTAQPLCIYAKDYDKNGLIDPVMCYFINGKNYIYPTRDEMIRQISSMRGRFQSYKDYAGATFEESFTKKEIEDAYVVTSECFESSYFENKGAGIFVRSKLPVEAQFAPIFGMIAGDYNDDGNLDVLLAGNSYATEASTGRYDAFTGLLLAGDGKGHFRSLSSTKTGFTADADAKGMAQLKGQDGRNIILLGNNASTMEAYQLNKKTNQTIAVKNIDLYAIIHKKNGQFYKQEFYWGSNYLSQSSRILQVGKEVINVSVYDNRGNKREEEIKN